MKIAPSLLSCDFAKMGEEIEKMDKCGADYMHLDVMDAHFVPNLTFGAPVIKAVRSYTEKPFDVHLMISEPLKYIDDFAKAGADIITFHAESDSDISKTIDKITENGIKPGLVIKPNTPASAVFPYLDKLFMEQFGIDLKKKLEIIILIIVLVTTLPIIIKFFFTKDKERPTQE